jgi:hypothetical protein
MKLRLIALAIAAGLLVVLPGCGSKKKGKETSLSVSETESAGKFALKGIQPSIPAGPVTIAFTNGGKADHHVQLIKVDGNHTAADVLKVISDQSPHAKIPAWLLGAGGTGDAHPGQTNSATQVLQPGTYYAVDDDSADNSDKSFAQQGAIEKFTVTGSKVKKDLPSQPASITVKNKGNDKFEFVDSGLKSGDTKLQFSNDTKELHHVVAFKIAPGKTAADVKKALASNGPPQGPPPFDPSAGGSTSIIDKDGKVNTAINFSKPGQYVLVCFLTDRDGKGKPHFQEGLFKQVDIK